MHLARDHVAAPLALGFVGAGGLQQLHRMADRSQWIAQFVRQSGEKLILALIRLDQRLLRALQSADVEVDARPAGYKPIVGFDGHALRQDGMILAILAAQPMFAVPGFSAAHAFLPCRHRVRGIILVHEVAPAEVRILFLIDTDQ